MELGMIITVLTLALVAIVIGIILAVSLSEKVPSVASEQEPLLPAVPLLAQVQDPIAVALQTEPVVEPEPQVKLLFVSDVEEANNQGRAWCSGNVEAEKVLLILSSCRGVHFANYILNHDFFANCCVYVVFVYIFANNHSLETMTQLLPKNVYYMFHEFISNFGFMNTDPRRQESVFQVPGLMHEQGRAIMTPNMPNALLRVRDLVKYDQDIADCFARYKNKNCSCTTNQDCGCRRELADKMAARRDACAEKYAAIMAKTNLPRTANVWRFHLKKQHLFNTLNHPSNFLSRLIFTELLEVHFAKEISEPCPESFFSVCRQPEFTGLSEQRSWTTWDRSILQYEWLDRLDEELTDPCEIFTSACG